jgi:hypothetical protein
MVFRNPYPPSSDIGFHGSIINLILDQGTLPAWNPYHMGGEQLATPPGFHLFVSILILLTGMTVILAELITAAFFSAVIVFPAYLVSRKIWRSHSAGLLAAFFAAISALSIEMISWGGYTNIVSLFLIIAIFYLFLRDIDKPAIKHLLLGTLLFGALVITHTFSLAVFLPVLALYLALLIAGKLGKFKEMRIQNMLRFFVVSAALGIVVVSPWILRVFNFYVNASAEGALTGGLDNRNLILANCRIDPTILTIIIVTIPALIMLKHSRKRFFDRSSLLLMAWFLVPVVMTQAYVFGIYTHYSRFVYFIDFPAIIIVSAILLYLSRITTLAINRFAKIRWNRIKKALPVMAFTIIMFVFIISSSWSIFPHEGMKEADVYSTIQQPEAATIEWIKNNTPADSVLVADHLYGWWLSGIAERPTLSAAGLEFLIYSNEREVAKNAQLLLDTDYYIDNGLIQVRDDGPYVSRHNPEVSIETWSGEAFALFQFNETRLEYNQENVTLPDMTIAENTIAEYENSTVLLTIRYENELFTVRKTLQVRQGVRFAELSYEIETKTVQANGFEVEFSLPTAATHNLTVDDPSKAKQIGAYNSYHKVAGQVIFSELYPQVEVDQSATNCAEIIYNSQSSSMNIKMFVGVFDAENLSYPEGVTEMYEKVAGNPLEKVPSDDELSIWKYTDMIEEFDVSYVVCRDQYVYMKFAKDPNFQLVFNCGNVAIFQVTK